ncbi:MAG: arsenate reductase ArsC, partial [Chloroflexi bacterium]|nr:arsenate reductase ArsC [Chloroflexota bacterium]
CTGNSARSQMAEGLLRHFAGDQFEVYSAGLEPRTVNPYAIQAMQEIGLDISTQQSKSVIEYLGHVHMGTVITVCSNAEERCPIFPFSTRRLYWPFEDPAAFVGTPDDTLSKFREVRDLISARLQGWLTNEEGITSRPLPTLPSAA